MGLGYKGGTSRYHSIGENAGRLKSKYQYNDKTGYFGEKGRSHDPHIRNMASEHPSEMAKQFYDDATYGGQEEKLSNGKGVKTTMRDGTVISYREVSSSDGSPAVQITISSLEDGGGIKSQKIHFVNKGGK